MIELFSEISVLRKNYIKADIKYELYNTMTSYPNDPESAAQYLSDYINQTYVLEDENDFAAFILELLLIELQGE